MRLGGFRPNVFFKTGLELGLWMTAASLAGWWLWRCGTIKKIGRFSFGSLLLPALLGTTILCRSTGALVLLAGGVLTLWLSIRFRTRWLLTALLLVGPVYVAIRVPNLWSGQQAVDLATALVGEERTIAGISLQLREPARPKALEQPIFGWGGWDRNVVFLDDDHEYRDANHMVMMDGLWIITLGTKGFFGLTLLYLALITPAALFIRRFPVRLWNDPRVAAGSLATTLLGLYIVDCLMNGFPNITYVTLAGGLISLDPKQLRSNPAGRPEATGRESQEALAEQYHKLGRSLKQDGHHDEAEASWQQALNVLSGLLKAKPDSPELRLLWCDCANDLAWLWANHPDPARRDPSAAVAMAHRIVEECPDSEVYWNTLGVAHYRAGDDTSAIAALDRAVTLRRCTAFDNIFLAMAHARLGNRETALEKFAHALTEAEHSYPGHAELAGFCDEARFVVTDGFSTPSTTH